MNTALKIVIRGGIPVLILAALICLGLKVLVSGHSDAVPDPSRPVDSQLRGMPYAPWVPVGDGARHKGVTIHEVAKSSTGFNVYSVPDQGRAFVTDMGGSILRTWSMDDLSPQGELQHVEFGPSGELFAVIYTLGLVKLTRESELVWSIEMGIHHDIAFDEEEGRIYTLCYEGALINKEGIAYPILNDSILVLSPDGTVIRRISMIPLFKNHISHQRFAEIGEWMQQRDKKAQAKSNQRKFELSPDTPPDVFHINSIQLLPRSVKGVGAKGDLLISVRELDLVAVIDRQTEELRWTWGADVIQRQHHATLLENDHVLIFDNGLRRGDSRVIEVDPQNGQIVWQYASDPPSSFFSPTRGAAQRLPNGNTLITESDKGRAFEVTQAGEIVWEFYNPITKMVDTDAGPTMMRAAIYRLDRVAQP